MEKPEMELGSFEEANGKKNIKSVLIFVALTSLVQMITVGVYSYNALKEREEDAAQQALNREISILMQQSNRQDNKYREIEYTVISLRASLEEIGHICSIDKSNSIEKNKRIDTLKNQVESKLINLVQAFGGSQLIFGDKLFNNMLIFKNQIDEYVYLNNTDLCNKLTPNTFTQITKNSIAIENLMFNSMSNTSKRMDEITSKMIKN